MWGGVLAYLVPGWLVGVSVIRFVITLFAEGSLSSPEMECFDINCFLSLFLNFFVPFCDFLFWFRTGGVVSCESGR